MVIIIIMLSIGFVLIIKGGDWFLDSAVWISEKTGIPKMIIGATVVSFATTLPESLVTILAVSQGSYDLGITNAIGSAIANTGLILSLSLIFLPSVVNYKVFGVHGTIMMCSALWLLFCLHDNFLSVNECIPLLIFGAGFFAFNISCAKEKNEEKPKKAEGNVIKNIVLFIAGTVCIVLGARLLIDYGIALSAQLGIPESVVGVTVVAVGTSLPELVCTITAIIKRETNIGVGNILGANIINITLLMGISGLMSDGGLTINPENFLGRIMPRISFADMPVMILMFLILLIPAFINKGKLKRYQGILMMLLYLGFTFAVIY